MEITLILFIFSQQFAALEYYEEYRPPTINEVLHPLVSRLFDLSRNPVVNYEASDSRENMMARIEGQLSAFEEKEIEQLITFILGRIQVILGRNRSYSRDLEFIKWEYTDKEVEQLDRQLVEELQYYQTSLSQMLDFYSIDKAISPQSTKKQKAPISNLKGLSLHAIADTQEERNKKINEFCEGLVELGLIDKKDEKLIKPAFTGGLLPRKVNWKSEAYNLGYLINILTNSGGQGYIKRPDILRHWKRTCEIFTVQGKDLQPQNLKTNKTSNDPEIKSALDTIVGLLR